MTVSWFCTLCLFGSGDAGSFLLRLSKGLKGHRCPEEWPQSLKAGDETKENANRYSQHKKIPDRSSVCVWSKVVSPALRSFQKFFIGCPDEDSEITEVKEVTEYLELCCLSVRMFAKTI